jgi:DNA-binding CsgD family transcriptional regulator
MSKSALLRVRDVRDAYRLIGECRDLSVHPGLWQPHMFEALRRLVGAAVGSGGEGFLHRPGPVQVVTIFDTFEPGDRAHFLAWVRDNGPVIDPLFQALERVPGSLVTRTRRQLISDASWYRSPAFNEYRRKAHVDHQLTSMSQISRQGAISMLVVHRSVGERNFSAREQRLLHFFHQELTPLIGRALVSATEPTPNDLSRRLRQTLSCLLEGDSEKQVAVRLGLSHATTHQYVTALYRRFGVHTRAQLLAHAFRRMSQDGWKTLVEARSPAD